MAGRKCHAGINKLVSSVFWQPLSDLAPLGSCEIASEWDCCTFVPGAGAVVGQTDVFVPSELTVVKWRAAG